MPRFEKLNPTQRLLAESLLAEYLKRPRHAGVVPGSRRFYYLVGAAASMAVNGHPPNRYQRLGYRTQKRRRAKLEMIKRYGDPESEFPLAK